MSNISSNISSNASTNDSEPVSSQILKLFQIVQRKTKNTKVRELKIEVKCTEPEFKKWQNKLNKIKECSKKFKWILLPKQYKFHNKIFNPFASILFEGYEISLVDKIQKRRQSDNYFSETEMWTLLNQLLQALQQIQTAKKSMISNQQNCGLVQDLIAFIQPRSILVNCKNQIGILTNISVCEDKLNSETQTKQNQKQDYFKQIAIIMLLCSDLQWEQIVCYKAQTYEDLLYKFQLNNKYSNLFKFFVLKALCQQNTNNASLLQKYMVKRQLSKQNFTQQELLFIKLQLEKLQLQLKQLQKSRIVSVIPLKSQSDLRNYEVLILENQIKILFIQDQSIKKSACSIAVKVGSFQQPQRSPGLAHFLQHMLFMGSHQFPKQNEYDEYIVLNGGYTNAQTGNDLTKYFFQVTSHSFQGAVRRLVSFFTGTLLDQQAINKQIQAINQEYMINVGQEQYNKQIIMRQFMIPPFNKFTIGNKASLSKKWIRQDLVNFYNKWYSANLMTATIYSNFPIQHLKQQFVPIFQKIKNKRLKIPQYGIGFDKQKFKKIVKIPTDRGITLQFRFIVKCLKNCYRKHIEDYICHILGHEGKNSLFSQLKSKQLIFNLTASSAHLSQQTLISLQMDVVRDQNNQIQLIYNIIMNYIQKMVPEKRIYEQLKIISELAFKYFDKGFPADQVQALSQIMHYVPLKQIISFNYVHDQFDREAIDQVIKQMNEDNLLLLYQSQFFNKQKSFKQKYIYSSFKTVQQFQTQLKYKVEKLPQLKQEITQKIQFKSIQSNQYLPISEQIFDFRKQDNSKTFMLIPYYLKQAPQLIGKPQQYIVFARDTYFKTPKGEIVLQVFSQQTYTFKYFYTYFIKDVLKHMQLDFIYDAQLLDTMIVFDSAYTFKINIFGFNQVALKVLNQIGQNVMKIQDQSLFQSSYEYILDFCNSTDSMEPDQIANIMLDSILFKTQMTYYEMSQEVTKYKFNAIKHKIKDFWKKSSLMWYFIGNFDKNQVKKTVQKFTQNVQNSGQVNFKKNVQNPCLKLQKNIKYLYAYEQNNLVNSSALVYYQVGSYFQGLYHTLLLLSKVIEQPYYNQLRTQKQLAYALSVQICQKQNILGLLFSLTSSKIDPLQIATQIKKFVQRMLQKMKCVLQQQQSKSSKQCFVNDEKLFQLKSSIVSQISSPFTNFNELTAFVYDQIRWGSYNFNRRTKQFVQTQIKKIQKKDLYQLLKKISSNSLQVLVLSKKHEQKFAQNVKKLSQAQQNQFYQVQQIRSQFNYYDDFNLNRIKNLDLFIHRQD